MKEINPLNHAQLSSTVRGADGYYRIRPRRSLWKGYAVLVGMLLLAVFGGLILVVRVFAW